MNIPFSPPDISEEEIEEVVDALKSGWITTGPKTKRLEKELLQFTGTNVGVCLNSQTAAAEMTLRVLGIGPGDEVITSAYTYTATASVVDHVGAKLVLVDTQEDSLEMDYDKAAKLINENTKAVIPVDLAGIPCDYDRIFELVENKKELFHANNDLQKAFNRIIVIADTAHALGASYKGNKIGSVADFSNFSFHAVKNFTTAEGGYATWKDREGIDNEALYKQYQLLSLHGQSKDALNKTKLGSWEYDVMGPWYKCNMTDVLASIGLAQVKRYPELLKRRKSIIEKYDKNFRPLGVETLNHFDDNHESSGHLYITRIPGIDTDSRNKIIEEMAKVGVACNVHYKPLPLLTAYKNLGFDIKDYPNAYDHYKNEITLPLHTKLTDEEVDYVIDKYCEIVKNYL
ncbi:UDP-4-amino-4-deoxy-L-arabinose--oxoglutarate aminotransferase [Anaerococcus prevotii]|uniref:DegT/DnrJ/EryC1/StrS aminotransferase n=1 Tax=Anaerococcus prevotii (strain ATCC 9321 / DSM 20548 / JCM 6508 / NCTC 11806 / PC1) TaxID=525919 RepID=C7RDN1_ANAPD|nr:DegT/DnrJ/EryC1/StrS family aminotransferase [Anaerococcus prevotii]ACV29294.1 DegT/DnrJ/EryC1/StrS aminotransferase [Anaerococcus prevotii DSM 20548]SUU94968.1 UDP-4-amino-4-deoxy-L-arabinose--oxoglutarate aminotransferase [Anaerococcus prevotii]